MVLAIYQNNEHKNRRFKLSDTFIEQYKEREVPWGPLGYVVYKRTYARRLDDGDPNSPTEEWWQTCRRVIEGMFNIQKQHCIENRLPWNDAKAQRAAKEAYERLFVGKWTPPGRGLWMMNTKFANERTAAGLYNCAFISTEPIATRRANTFAWIMDALMLGIGVGFDTLGAGKLVIQKPALTDEVFVIPDTREGWVESVYLLLEGYFSGTAIPRFDYSLIRPAGAPIKGFGGTSSGAAPLIELHDALHEVLKPKIGQPISSIEIVDIANLIGKCVVAGNVRRSAEIAIGQVEDKDFALLKQDKEKLYDYRWSSNNSIEAKVGMDYSWYAEQSAVNGEPGYLWIDNARRKGRMKDLDRDDDMQVMGFNPCSEQQLEDMELCCLSEVFPARHDSYKDFLRSLKFAYLYAKTVTLTKTHWPETNQKMLCNRRIGLSLTGFIQAANKFGLRTMYDWCDQAYDYVQELDKQYSNWLCIPRSRRTTSIKPSGTVSKLFGATPGIHYPEAEYYIQRIRFQKDSSLLEELRKAGYHVEPCMYSPNTYVVEFPVKEPYFKKGKADVSMWEQLEIAAQVQYYWADNSVSVTVTFKEEEGKDIARALELYETRLKAVSFLKYENTGYEQAPMEPITKERYEEMIKSIKPIQRLNVSDDALGSKFCTNDSCEIKFT